MECPRCHQGTLAFDADAGTMRCGACGFRLFEDRLEAAEDRVGLPPGAAFVSSEAQQPTPTPPQRPPVSIALPSGMDLSAIPTDSDYERVRVQGSCHEAMIALARDDKEAARRALRSALELAPEFDQPWLFLAGLAASADEQREYLEHTLACNPANPIALEALLRLDGRLDAPAPVRDERLDSGQVAAERLVCPQCGGRLDYHMGEKTVVCHHCGYRLLDADEMARSGQPSIVLEGILKRKQQATPWHIGGRWLRCESCGATTTLPRRRMTNTCRFCGSRHVLREGVHHPFEQPDLIVPFAIGEDEARAAIEQALRSGLRRITRFFADAIERVELHGVYLPCWAFDADMIVHWSWTNAPAHGQRPILLNDVLYLAAPNPPRDLVEKIEPYDLRRGVDYDPRLLAVHPAELYDTDLTRASLDVRRKLTRQAMQQAEPGLRARRPAHGYDDEDPGSLRMNATTQFLTYRLALLPVWIARLVEEDGDVRQALVNGQTGRAALGRQQKAG